MSEFTKAEADFDEKEREDEMLSSRVLYVLSAVNIFSMMFILRTMTESIARTAGRTSYTINIATSLRRNHERITVKE